MEYSWFLKILKGEGQVHLRLQLVQEGSLSLLSNSKTKVAKGNLQFWIQYYLKYGNLTEIYEILLDCELTS